MIDSNAHLYFDAFDADRSQVIARARAAGVRAIIDVGVDVETSVACVRMARENEGFFAAVGLHPTSVLPSTSGSGHGTTSGSGSCFSLGSSLGDLDVALERIEALARENVGRVVAVGEIGLDYYWKDVPPEAQRPRLLSQLTLARRLGLPVVVHCRDALGDLFALLESQPSLPGGVFHCFAGTREDADRAVKLGFHISFAGNVTYPKAAAVKEVARHVPAERLLLETDCPFLPPQPKRGKRNEPAYLRETLESLAKLKEMKVEELELLTEENTRRLFHLGSFAVGTEQPQL